MRFFVAITIILLAASACVNDHLVVEGKPFKCDSTAAPGFSEVLPIVMAKCSTAGCHSADNDYIPHLTTKEQLIANGLDCISQIGNGAMPPTGYTLTEGEKGKILCWLNYGK